MKFEMMLAWYPVENLDAARRFYGEILGLRKVFEMPGWAEYAHGEKRACQARRLSNSRSL